MTKETAIVTQISIVKKESGHFILHFKVEGEEYLRNFYLHEAELLDILTEKKFLPFYADGYDLLQVTGHHLRFVNMEDPNRRLWVPFRDVELFPQLRLALALEAEVKMDLLPAFLDSLKMREPNVYETIADNALEITKMEGIEPFLASVRLLAKNSSRGQDDPVTLTFMKDYGPSDLYWVIARNKKQVMNGGVIYDENRSTWGIHT